MIDTVILVFLTLGLIPLCLAIFFYVTKPHPTRRGRRVFSRDWLNPIGAQLVFQKTILALLVMFILSTRLFGEYPGQNLIAYTLYPLLMAAFWAFLIVQRRVQRPYEKQQRSTGKRNTTTNKEDQ